MSYPILKVYIFIITYFPVYVRRVMLFFFIVSPDCDIKTYKNKKNKKNSSKYLSKLEYGL